ncbi:hypothetical protein BKA80DRAFT_41271 [Phyllosticta citrichinensis]
MTCASSRSLSNHSRISRNIKENWISKKMWELVDRGACMRHAEVPWSQSKRNFGACESLRDFSSRRQDHRHCGQVGSSCRKFVASSDLPTVNRAALGDTGRATFSGLDIFPTFAKLRCIPPGRLADRVRLELKIALSDRALLLPRRSSNQTFRMIIKLLFQTWRGFWWTRLLQHSSRPLV